MKFEKYSLFYIVITLITFSGCQSGHQDFDVSKATFVGRESCVQCHEKEYNDYLGSDHDMAMDSATDKTVLGDFNNATFTRNGFTSKMYKKDGKFYVHTKGPDGKPGDFQIAYTFGYQPLQQYLVPFEKGRLQCLQITWDTDRKVWYHLSDSIHHGTVIKPDDWLYWTNNGQNWNGMCAECHSTNLRKNYNPKTHDYHTTWSEIDVSCEACHGPASKHLKWAELPKEKRTHYAHEGLVVQTSNISSDQLISQCAYCHARRSSFEDFIHPRKDLFNIIKPQLPIEPSYHVDGQILDEDYVYSSFTQSKMYMNNVRCTNCHDVHSLKVKYNGENKLCLQCHIKADYDTPKHHFHKYPGSEGKPIVLNNGKRIIEVGEGSKCINCHMPGQYYMGVDFRRDHSMRIPRPDLTIELGTPNACNSQCHTDKSPQWAESFTKKWYGMKRRPQFGEAFSKAINGDTTSIQDLINWTTDSLNPPIIRAAATKYLGGFPSQKSIEVLTDMLHDKSAMVRSEAVSAFPPISSNQFVKYIAPLMQDSVRMVRLDATFAMSFIPVKDMDTATKRIFDRNVKEYIKVMNYSADFAASRVNMANLYSNLGNYKKAEENFLEAIRIDNLFYPAKVNLAMLYNKTGRNNQAEKLLKEVLSQNPDMSDVYYSLGLLMAEKKEYQSAATYLQQAAKLMPDRPRVWYNLALVEQYLQHTKEAEKAFLKVTELQPQNSEYLAALIDFYLKTGNNKAAHKHLLQWIKIHPEDQSAQQLINKIDGK